MTCKHNWNRLPTLETHCYKCGDKVSDVKIVSVDKEQREAMIREIYDRTVAGSAPLDISAEIKIPVPASTGDRMRRFMTEHQHATPPWGSTDGLNCRCQPLPSQEEHQHATPFYVHDEVKVPVPPKHHQLRCQPLPSQEEHQHRDDRADALTLGTVIHQETWDETVKRWHRENYQIPHSYLIPSGRTPHDKPNVSNAPKTQKTYHLTFWRGGEVMGRDPGSIMIFETLQHLVYDLKDLREQHRIRSYHVSAFVDGEITWTDADNEEYRRLIGREEMTAKGKICV